MILADFLPHSSKSVQVTEKVEVPALQMITTNSSFISPMSIPWSPSESLLAVSPKHLLVSKQNKQQQELILIDEHLEESITDVPVKDTMVDALWCDAEERFLLLTAEHIYSYHPELQTMECLANLRPEPKKIWKCFAYSSVHSTLFIGYDEWESKFIEQCQRDEQTHEWKQIQHQSINLTSNEFLGNLTVSIDDSGHSIIAISIYNDLTEQWRMEIRSLHSWLCLRTLRFHGSSPSHDFRMLAIQTATCNIRWLIYSQLSNNILTVDQHWKSLSVDYRQPLRRIFQFKDNNLIVQTLNQIDIHLYC